jgi:GTP cyclohydrolase I
MNLKSVGIENLEYPVKVRCKSGGRQDTVARVDLGAEMPRDYRGSCVSVFVAVLDRFQDDISPAVFPELLAAVREELGAQRARVEVTFPYFVEKSAPVTGTAGLMEYTCRFTGEADGHGYGFTLSIRVPLTTLCPCSREISDEGAHNQRAVVNLKLRPKGMVWIEDMIAMIEDCGSAPVYSLLKRPDEKFVTEQAYRNPMFVEDVVRQVAVRAAARPDIAWFSVETESFESIHNHNAYALVDSRDILGASRRA